MATVQLGALVTAIKGKVGGTVFQGSKTGTSMKNKPSRGSIGAGGKLTKADAGRMFNSQAAISQLASAWRSLSGAQRLSWATAAPSFPFLNKYGESYVGSGYQLYMSMNARLIAIDSPTIDEAPAPETLVNCPSISFTYDAVTGMSISCPDGVATGYVLNISATVGISAGRQPTPGLYKIIAQLPAGTSFPFVSTADYTRVFGAPPIGTTIWIQGKLTKADAGRSGTNFTASTVVTP